MELVAVIFVALAAFFMFRDWLRRTKASVPPPQHEGRRIRRLRSQEAQRRRLHGG